MSTFAEGVTAETIAGKASRRMDCLDCHTRPAHTFETSPARAVDEALGRGAMSASIPFLRREAVRALSTEYPSRDVALAQIEQTTARGIDPLQLTRRTCGAPSASPRRSTSAACFRR